MSFPTSPTHFRASLAVCIALFAASAAHATSVTIVDPSFEGVSLSPGGFTSGNGPSGGGYAANSWNSNSNAGIFRPTASSYSGGVPDGVNAAYSNSGAAIDQVLTANLTVNTTYTLSVDIGSRADGPFNNGYTIELLAGGVLLSSTTNTPAPANGSFVLATDTFTASAGNAQLGQPLEIKLISANTGQTNFDNVTLDASPTPEPTSGALLCLTTAGAALRRWRRKN